MMIFIALCLALLREQALASPVRSTNSNSNNNNRLEQTSAAFHILGLDRGQLIVNPSTGEIHATEVSSSSDVSAAFGFCQGGSMISQIGHVSVMEVCKAGEPTKKMVYSSLNGRVYMRTPQFDDDVLQAVIYENQKLFFRRSSHRRHILVADVEGSGSTSVRANMHEYHVDVRTVDHVRDIEAPGRVASWTIRVTRNWRTTSRR